MGTDAIIARQCEKIGELEEQVRQLKKLLVPAFVTPVEWGLNRQEQALFCMFLNRDLVTRDMFAIARTKTNTTSDPSDVVLCRLRKKTKKIGIQVKTVWGVGWRLVDRKSWRQRNDVF